MRTPWGCETHTRAYVGVCMCTQVMWVSRVTVLNSGRIFTAAKINSGAVIKTQNPYFLCIELPKTNKRSKIIKTETGCEKAKKPEKSHRMWEGKMPKKKYQQPKKQEGSSKTSLRIRRHRRALLPLSDSAQEHWDWLWGVGPLRPSDHCRDSRAFVLEDRKHF